MPSQAVNSASNSAHSFTQQFTSPTTSRPPLPTDNSLHRELSLISTESLESTDSNSNGLTRTRSDIDNGNADASSRRILLNYTRPPLPPAASSVHNHPAGVARAVSDIGQTIAVATGADDGDDNDGDFAPRRRHPIRLSKSATTVPDGWPTSLLNSHVGNDEDGDEENVILEKNECLICHSPWTTVGPHRLVSLACGHLFGNRCIRRWIQMAPKLNNSSENQRKKKPACPICKKSYTRKDIRPIYAKMLTVVDNERVEIHRKRSEQLEKQNCELTSSLEHYRSQFHIMRQEVIRQREIIEQAYQKEQAMQREIERLNRELNYDPNREEEELGQLLEDIDEDDLMMLEDDVNDAIAPLELPPQLHYTIGLAKEEGGTLRVVAFHPAAENHSGLLYVSYSNLAENQHTMIEIDNALHSSKIQRLLPSIHTGEIRGAEISPHLYTDWHTRYMLTVSMDATATVVDLGPKQVVHRFQTNNPAWSCAWDPTDRDLCYVGTAGGIVLAFDLRFPDRPIHSWNGSEDGIRPFHQVSSSAKHKDEADALETKEYSAINSIIVVKTTNNDGSMQQQQSTRLVVANAKHLYALPSMMAADKCHKTKKPSSWLQLTQNSSGNGELNRSCYSASYDPHLGLVAASFRAEDSKMGKQITMHEIFRCSFWKDEIGWELHKRLASKSPQTRLSRTSLLTFVDRQNKSLFCAGVESTRCLDIWDVSSTTNATATTVAVSSLPDCSNAEYIVDVRGHLCLDKSGKATNVLATLTNTKLRLYCF